MSETNNNTPMRITQLEEATEYPEGAYIPIAKAGSGTKKIGTDVLPLYIDGIAESPVLSLSDYCYYQTASSLAPISSGSVKKYNIKSNTDYYITTSFYAGDSGFYLISYFDENDDFISAEYQNNTSNTTTLNRVKANIPNGAAWFYVNARNSNIIVDTVKYGNKIENIYKTLMGSTTIEFEPETLQENYVYYQESNAVVSISGYYVGKYVISENTDYYITSSIQASSTGFPLISYFDENNDYISSEYPNSTIGKTEIENRKANIPNGAAWFYVNGKTTPPKVRIYNKDTFQDTVEKANSFEDMLVKVNIEPLADISGYAFYTTGEQNVLTTVANAKVKKIKVETNTTYYVSTSFTASSVGFPLIAYYDSNNDFISYEFMNNPGTATTIKDQQITIPNGAAWFYVNSRYVESQVYTISNPEMSLAEFEKKIGSGSKYEISILFIGNSLTQDGVAYLPYLLCNYYPEIKFKFYMWYNGGYNLSQQYQKFIDNGFCEIFSIAENSPSWVNMNLRMSDVLTMFKFDIVCMQEYFNHKETYTESDLTDWNNCRDYIQSNYTGGNGLEFITLFHAPKRSAAQSVFELTLSGNELELQKTIAEDMIPVGIAVYRALSTDLDNLGDQGHLSPDGIHTQEGLPCLLQTYTALCWLFDKLSINKSVYGLPFKMTTSIYNMINVPGPNLGTGVIEGTDAQNLLAQEVAIQAYKEGKYYVENNIFSI